MPTLASSSHRLIQDCGQLQYILYNVRSATAIILGVPLPSLNGGVTLAQPLDSRHFVPGSHATQVHQDIVL